MKLLLVVLAVTMALTPLFGVTNRDVSMLDVYTFQWVDVPQGTVVIVYATRQGWCLSNVTLYDEQGAAWFYQGWIKCAAIDF